MTRRLSLLPIVVSSLSATAVVGLQPDSIALSAPDAAAAATPDDHALAVRACNDAGLCWSHPSVPRVDLNAVWARAKNDAWIVGAAGTALHWDGSAWTQVETETTDDLVALHGAPDSPEVWALGSSGVLIRWDGSRWQHLWRAPARQPARDEAKLHPIDVVVPELAQHPAAKAKIGDEIDRRAGKALQNGVDLRDIWGPDFSHVWVVGGALVNSFYAGEDSSVALVRTFNGRTWSSQTQWSTRGRITGRPLRSVLGSAPDDVWVTSVGSGGRCPSWGEDSCLRPQHWDGKRWSPAKVLPEPVKLPAHVWKPVEGVLATWKATRETSWSASSDGSADSVAMLRGSWQNPQVDPTTRLTLPKGAPKDVRGTADDDVWVVGKAGLIFHWDGHRWSGSTNERQAETLNAVWSPSKGKACVAGDRGRVMCWSGQSWSELPAPTPERLLSIWGRRVDDLWVVGDKGQAFRWDGQRWTAIKTGTTEALNWVRGTTDGVWMFGSGGAGIRVDAGGIKSVSSALHGRPKAILGGDGDDLVVYGPPLVGAHEGALVAVPKELSDLLKFAATIQAIAGSPARGIWAYGDQKMFRVEGGAKRDSVDVLGSYQLWVGPKGDVWAAPMTSGPAFLHREAGAWKRSVAHLPPDLPITAMSGDEEDLWMVGAKGMILRRRTSPGKP